MRIRRVFGNVIVVAVAVFSVLFASISPASAENRELTVKVMTRNMYPGAELAVIAAASNEMEFEEAVQSTIESVIQSRIPERAARLAAEIAETKPDVVALQEATIWKIESESGSIVLDQLALLLHSLRAAGQHYKVGVIQKLTDVQLPGVLTYTDHDAILVRSDLPAGQLNVLGTEAHIYEALMSFPVLDSEIQVLRGWVAMDLKIRGARFKFVNTHLEAPLAGLPETAELQFAQAAQLVDDLQGTNLPVILAGDFNSDAEVTKYYPPDATLSYEHIVDAGYVDAWHELFPSNPGYTWPLLAEGLPPGQEVIPIERIDLIFSKGPEAIWMARTGMEPGMDGLYTSDHVGVVAVFQILNHCAGHHFRAGRSDLHLAR